MRTAHFRWRPGVSLLELLVVLAVLGVFSALLMSAIQRVRHAAARASCISQLRQLGLALHQYHDTHRALPIGTVRPYNAVYPELFGPRYDAYPLMTWLTRLLPYVEQEALWRTTVKAMAADIHMGSDPPHAGLSTRVKLFICPTDGRVITLHSSIHIRAPSSYLGVSGTNRYLQDGLLYQDSRLKLADALDGTSHTLLVGERPHDFAMARWFGAWYGGATTSDFGATGNTVLGVRESGVLSLLSDHNHSCHDGPYSYGPGSLNNPCSVFHFWSLHPGGGNWLFADGSVRVLPYSAAPMLKALATRAGGETVDLAALGL